MTPVNAVDRGDRYAVVGAGPGGLATARWLAACGIAADVFERNPRLGGIWDIEAPGSPMYDSAHFISSKTLSGFRDFPMPDSYPDYPSHGQILAYLKSYADHHKIADTIEFGAEVKAARPAEAGDGSWIVEVNGEVRRYAGLVVATGLQWIPNRPELPGRFDGEILHSAAYRSPRQAEGRRVLVVGGGNSGCDIAVDVSGSAARAFLSLRRGYWFIPKHLFGMPADVFGHRGPQMPSWLEQRVFERLLRLLLGDLRRLGLPAPDHRLFETHPVLNTQVLNALAHGALTVKTDVRELRGSKVAFADGSEEELDLVIFATGYRHAVPILSPDVFREGDTSGLYLQVCHRQHPQLFFVGFFETDAGSFPLVDRQAELVARLIRARREAPATARRFESRIAGPAPDFSSGVRFLKVDRMKEYVRVRPYTRLLDSLLRELS